MVSSISRGGSITITAPQGDVGYIPYELNFDRNVKIRNYKENDAPNTKRSNATIQDGNVSIYNNGENVNKTLRLNESAYLMLNSIRKLDGNNSDISEKDLELAESKKSQLDIKSIIRNVKDGIVKIIGNSGWVVELDFETEREEQARKAEENYALSDLDYKQACSRGRDMQDCLHGVTTDSDWREFNGYLNQTNAKNVLQTLRGYKYESCDNSTFYNSERFFQQLFTESGHKDDKLNATSKMIKYVLEFLKDNKCRINNASDLKTANDVEKTLREFKVCEENLTNGNGKMIDNLMDKLFEIFKVEYKNLSFGEGK